MLWEGASGCLSSANDAVAQPMHNNEIIFVIYPLSGQVAEWLKAPVSKTGIPATVS